MDVLFTIGMLALMAAAIVVLGRSWPRSSRGGGFRAGRSYGAGTRGSGAAGDGQPPVPEDDDTHWRWKDHADASVDHAPPPEDRPGAGGTAR